MKPFRCILFFALSYFSFTITFASNNIKVIHNGKYIYFAHTVIVKYKNIIGQNLSKLSGSGNELSELLKNYDVKSLTKTFSAENSQARKIGLDRIITVEYSRDLDPLYAAAKMKKLPGIEWAEPKYIRRVDFIPDDPDYNANQWYLRQINAPQAWDISKGDTSVIIGIIDTGVDWTHPDIRGNMWYGIGYDLGGSNGTPDNNPIELKPDHGTSVAGVASAVTNNQIGIASIGFNTHLMAVKITQDNMIDSSTNIPYLLYPFEGIEYAADHGAKVINCSFGGPGFSNMEQEVIYYAIAKGALVVAAAGNDHVLEDSYPASYDGVLSVAATYLDDIKPYFSSYGYNVDCSAPGESIYTTKQPDTYAYESGTSFSAPLVSGLAGLVFAHFPNFTPLQVAEQIRVNCDNIDQINPDYKHLLGYGRINAYKALSNINSVSIRAYDIQFSDNTAGGNNDGNFQPGEDVEVRVKFRNYLTPASNVSISLESLSSYATVENGNFNITSIGTLDSIDNYSDPFKIKISNNIPFDDTTLFILNYSAANYSDYQFASTIANHSFQTEDGNNIALTITSNGSLGFNDLDNYQGEGFRFMNGSNLLFEGALMFGTSDIKLSDEARNRTADGKDTSFQIVEPFKIMKPGPRAPQEGTAIFNDNGSGSNKLGITVNLHSYSFNDPDNKNSIILNYNFLNTNDQSINNFYSGLFLDWDFIEGSGKDDYAFYDFTGNLGFAYHNGGNPDTYVGTALISSDNYGFWAIRNDSGSTQLYDGFTKSEKWKTLSSKIGMPNAGPGDISEVISAGPFSINAGKSLDVAFAITAGNNLNDLRTNISNARILYSNSLLDTNNRGSRPPAQYSLSQNYPNPFNPGTEIDYEIPEAGRVTLKVYDILGNLVKTLVDEDEQPAAYNVKFFAGSLASGIYIYQLKVNSFVSTKKFVLIK